MPITQINQSMFKEYEVELRKRVTLCQEKLSQGTLNEYSQKMYIEAMEIAESSLTDSSTYLLEPKYGFYYVGASFSIFINRKDSGFAIHEMRRDAWRREDMEEFFRLNETVSGYSISDYGLADSIEQIEEYLKEIEPITGLDKIPYFVVVSNHPPQDAEWRKNGPYIGKADSPSDVPIVQWHIYTLN